MNAPATLDTLKLVWSLRCLPNSLTEPARPVEFLFTVNLLKLETSAARAAFTLGTRTKRQESANNAAKYSNAKLAKLKTAGATALGNATVRLPRNHRIPPAPSATKTLELVHIGWPMVPETIAVKSCINASFGTPEERFWSKVNKNGPTSEYCPNLGNCWDWEGTKQSNGYGRLQITGDNEDLAHRWSYIINVGAIPPGSNILHKCHRRICVNFAHLYPGTIADNARDMVQAQRSTSPLTIQQVISIRSRYVRGKTTQQSLATEFGVDISTISHIVLRKHFKHI